MQVDTAKRQLSDQIDDATQRLLDAARVIPEPDLRRPSLLPGWTRAHVLAHLAKYGQERPAYTSAEARDADIEYGATLPARELVVDVARSAMAFRTIVKQLPDDAWSFPVRILNSAPFPAAQILTRRLVEVELHHGDLDAGYSPADWPPYFAAMELTEPMQSQRRDRINLAKLALSSLDEPRT